MGYGEYTEGLLNVQMVTWFILAALFPLKKILLRASNALDY